jgi:hypothetical protein
MRRLLPARCRRHFRQIKNCVEVSSFLRLWFNLIEASPDLQNHSANKLQGFYFRNAYEMKMETNETI